MLNMHGSARIVPKGGRALSAVVRPYAFAIAGIPQEMKFDMATQIFTLEFLTPHLNSSSNASPSPENSGKFVTEIFVPKLQYEFGMEVTVSDGSWEVHCYDAHQASVIIVYKHTDALPRHTLVIAPLFEMKRGNAS